MTYSWKNALRTAILWGCTFTLTGSLPADGKIPFFNDGFDTAGLLVETYKLSSPSVWQVENGRLISSDGRSALATLKKEVPLECEVEVDVIPQTIKKDFAGIRLHGVNFLIRPDGFWYVYRVQGVERSLGGINKTPVQAHQKYNFKVTCKKLGQSLMFTWIINGEKAAEFIEPGKIDENNGFALFAHNMPTAYDNLAISWFNFVDYEINGNARSLLETNLDATKPIVWKCPSNPNAGWGWANLSYGYNVLLGYFYNTGVIISQVVNIAKVTRPSMLIMASDGDGDKVYDSYINATYYVCGNRHSPQGCVVSFVDLHVAWMKQRDTFRPGVAWDGAFYSGGSWDYNSRIMWGAEGYYAK